jgi:cell division protein FtsB
MTQRRTPGGQGPARRPGSSGRGAGRGTGRLATRDLGGRAEPRVSAAARSTGRGAGTGHGGEGSRSASRPAAARRAAAGRAAKRTPAPRPRRFTGRATALLLVLATLALGYTYPVRVYLAQESEIARMEAAQAAQRQKIGELTEEVAKWQDPAYIEAQARRRFYYVRPGVTPLLVLDDPEGAARDAGAAPATGSPAPDRWYDTLWSSIEAANHQPRQ